MVPHSKLLLPFPIPFRCFLCSTMSFRKASSIPEKPAHHPNLSDSNDVAPNVIEFLDSLKNYEKAGVPRGAGTDSSEGFDLGRMRRLLSRLGDPLSQYPVVHIAGTKGKGSTAAFVSNILRAEGYSVGSYTSPHISSLCERIIAGKTEEPISLISFQKLLQDTWKIIQCAIAEEQGSLSHFEVLTALAFKHFAREEVNIGVIEAGLGGARDATNVILPNQLAVAVITNVGEEHLAALGGSLESIAVAKSGIIKRGCPVVLGGPLDIKVAKIISEVAKTNNARTVQAFGPGMHYSVNEVKMEDNGAFQCCDISVDCSFQHENISSWKIENLSLKLRMIGLHQLHNVLTAICTILCLRDQGWRVQESAIWSGLEHTVVPGRFQIVAKEKAMKLGCKSILVLDGAHTAGSAKALADTLRMVFPRYPLALVIAMASDKDHYQFSSQLLAGAMPKIVVAAETLVAGGQFRSTSSCSLADIWSQLAKKHKLEVTRFGQNDPGSRGSDLGFEIPDFHFQQSLRGIQLMEEKILLPEAAIIIAESKSIVTAIQKASQLLETTHKKGVVCVTGSLHAVSAVLSFI